MRVGLCRRKYKAKVIVTVVFIFLFVLFCFILKRLEPAFVEYAQSYGNEVVVDIINNTAYEVFDKYNISGIQKENNGLITTDTSMLNKLKSDFTTIVQQKLRKTDNIIKMPLGSISGFYLLNGLGPLITVRILPLSTVKTNFENKFVSEGINYVKHSIYINVSVDILYKGFLLNSSNVITTQVLVIENINSGSVPQYYGINDSFIENF